MPSPRVIARPPPAAASEEVQSKTKWNFMMWLTVQLAASAPAPTPNAAVEAPKSAYSMRNIAVSRPRVAPSPLFALVLYTQTVYTLNEARSAGMPASIERQNREERVDVRMRTHEKEFLKSVANAAGLTLSGLIVSSALREARRITKTTLTTREQAAVLGELLLKPPAPAKTAVESLRKARRYPTK